MTIPNNMRLEHDLADLIHAQFVLWRHAHTGPTEEGKEAAMRKYWKNEERLREMLDLADINEIKRAVLGATAIL